MFLDVFNNDHSIKICNHYRSLSVTIPQFLTAGYQVNVKEFEHIHVMIQGSIDGRVSAMYARKHTVELDLFRA